MDVSINIQRFVTERIALAAAGADLVLSGFGDTVGISRTWESIAHERGPNPVMVLPKRPGSITCREPYQALCGVYQP